MQLKEQKGFTLVEVVLFLALSGFFLLVAFNGIRQQTAEVQFTDSMRSLQNFVMSERNKVLNGVNSSQESICDSSFATGTNEECIVIGRVLKFGRVTTDEVEVDVLYGKRFTADEMSGISDLKLIEDSIPSPDASNSKFDISWGTVFLPDLSKDIKPPPSSDQIDSIGWLRSPASSRIIPVAFLRNTDTSDTSITGNFTQANNAIFLDDAVHNSLCFIGSNGQTSALVFGDGTGTDSVEILFDSSADAVCL